LIHFYKRTYDRKMSQAQLTSFFTQSKRNTRSSKASKVIESASDVQNLGVKRTTRGKKCVENDVSNVSEVKESVRKVFTEIKEVDAGDVNKIPFEEDTTANPKRGRKKLEDVTQASNTENDCPSPAKRTRRGKNIENVIEKARKLEKSKKLTPSEVKNKLGGVKKLDDLKNKLKQIEKSAETVKEARAKLAAAEKKVAEDKAKAKAKEEYQKSPAYVNYHNLAVKADGSLPLPYPYKFLAEVFRCTETIAAMLHNRKEVITVDKLKGAVQQMMRKDFNLSYLKQIKTVFPEAYRYAWDNIIGRYGKKLAEFELQMTVNLNYKKDMVGMSEPSVKDPSYGEKLGPQGIVERKTIFHNSLVNIVKSHHTKFCAALDPPVAIDDEKLLKFHKDFDVDKCPPIIESDFPEAPVVEKVVSAAQILEKSRALFEINPKLSSSLAESALKKSDDCAGESKPVECSVADVIKPASKPLRKELQGLPPKLIEKILAKEAEKAAKEMFTDKDREERIKRLRRLPTVARILKNTFTSEKKPALPLDMVLKKAVASYPGHIPAETMTKDFKYLVEVSKPWIATPMVQGTEYIKLNKAVDVNTVVLQCEKLLKDEEK